MTREMRKKNLKKRKKKLKKTEEHSQAETKKQDEEGETQGEDGEAERIPRLCWPRGLCACFFVCQKREDVRLVGATPHRQSPEKGKTLARFPPSDVAVLPSRVRCTGSAKRREAPGRLCVKTPVETKKLRQAEKRQVGRTDETSGRTNLLKKGRQSRTAKETRDPRADPLFDA